MFSDVISHQVNVSFLKKIYNANRIPNSLIFHGRNGVGKLFIALRFCRYILCQGDQTVTCRCSNCKRIENYSHPDIITLRAKDSKIHINDIRNIKNSLDYVSFYGSSRVVIINDAHFMTTEASNSLLKLLEEPPEKTFFILVTDQPTYLLKTISSRSQSILFGALSINDIEKYIINRFKVAEEKATMIARISYGSLGDAIRLCLSSQDVNSFITDFIDLVLNGSKSKKSKFVESINEDFDLKFCILFLMSILIDSLCTSFKSTNNLLTSSFTPFILDISRKFTRTKIIEILKKLLDNFSVYESLEYRNIALLDFLFNLN